MPERALPKTLSIRDIYEARAMISGVVRRTPLVLSHALSEATGASIHLKLEQLQDIGAFKVRGAANKLLRLPALQQQQGVTTFSTGNHGLAVAFVANKMGIPAVICISNRVPKAKVDRIRRYHAQVVMIGQSQDEAGEHCEKLQQEQGLTIIAPFDDPYVIAGQGTIGLELVEDLPRLDKVIVPLSGGGLLSGIALAVKSIDPRIQVIGVSMEKSAVMYESLKTGKPLVLPEEQTLADSLLGGIGLENQYTFQMTKDWMDDVYLVSEEEIARGVAYVLEHHRMIVEGAAATCIAAIRQHHIVRPGENVVCIMSGCNVDLSVVTAIAQKYATG
ncbi:hydroxyectoine utilization dehydratase EutB [Brevibacillus humidisoli]|uniref:hydroxyectoine utilization dehydratase EutB n=1 Tax=Brevibacillus humidisoli TaxID=2895522 RepID=UPI001E39BD48|nr:hydroxyectoine utilization dehydratase EutB [Brevibacillus humidisoli]UFJ42237.1 hydroxyectoine utilization dehydratase EutB [Brevibacillus humidisoli]